MREIKFRGLTDNTDGTKEWNYGYLGRCECDYTIENEEGLGSFVDRETVGQYTGLKDKNGTEIYEGDIIIFNHIKDEYPEADNIFLHNVNSIEYQKKYVAEFCNTYYRYGVRFRNGSTHFMVVQATITNHNVEVIGNIHERSIAIDN